MSGRNCMSGIVVLCGGPGGERAVSLVSGQAVQAALARAGVAARLVVVPEHEPEAFLTALDCSLAVMMLHGDFGEDGAAQAILEARGIPFSGSGSAACRLSMDKTATKDVMRRVGAAVPEGILLRSAEGADRALAAAGLAYPVFVKPNGKGSSVGASRVESAAALSAAVDAALRTGDAALVEECVAGRELTQGWLGGRLLPLVGMTADGAFYDYHAKYHSEKTRYVCPADIPAAAAARIGGLSLRILGAVGMRDLARVDVMLRENGEPVFLEVNALPGFTAHSLVPMAAAAAGIGMEALCLSLVEMALARGAVHADSGGAAL